jgi:hypothetical protein
MAMTIPIVPVVFVLLGLVLYFVSPNAKVARVGEIIFFAAFLAVMFSGGHTLTMK